MNIPWRLLSIIGCFALSIALIRVVKTASVVASPEVKIACIPLNHATADELDAKLNDYYHIAHTTVEPKGASPFRCYFRFPIRDIACVPAAIASRNQSLSECTSITRSENRSCYFFNKRKYARLIDLLKREPAVSKDTYQGQDVTTWQEARDILINH